MPSGFVITRNRLHLRKAGGVDIMNGSTNAPAHRIPPMNFPRIDQARRVENAVVEEVENEVPEEIEPEPVRENEPEEVNAGPAENEHYEPEPQQPQIEPRRSRRDRRAPKRLINEI